MYQVGGMMLMLGVRRERRNYHPVILIGRLSSRKYQPDRNCPFTGHNTKSLQPLLLCLYHSRLSGPTCPASCSANYAGALNLMLHQLPQCILTSYGAISHWPERLGGRWLVDLAGKIDLRPSSWSDLVRCILKKNNFGGACRSQVVRFLRRVH